MINKKQKGEKPHGACRVKLKQWALERGQHSWPGFDCLDSGCGHQRERERKRRIQQCRGRLAAIGWWADCRVVGLPWWRNYGFPEGGLFAVPLPSALGSLSAWLCQRTGDWRGGAGGLTGFARSSVHVRSTGDLGSWKGDICSTSCQATSALLIVPPTPFLQKLSACAAAGSPI